jgi:hypothetical protein
MALKNVSEVFKHEFSRIMDQIGSENYSSCRKISANLIRFSGMIDFDTGIFIGEVLEAIFSETDMLINTHEVKETDRETIKVASSACISGLEKMKMDGVSDHDLQELLRDLRVVVTKTQFEYWDTSDTKEKRGIFGLEE